MTKKNKPHPYLDAIKNSQSDDETDMILDKLFSKAAENGYNAGLK
jgi:hypothetical protein